MTVKERVHRHVEALPESDLQVVERILRGLTLPPPETAESRAVSAEGRKARVAAVRGSMKGKLSTVDEFIARKQEEIALEEAKWRRLHSQQRSS